MFEPDLFLAEKYGNGSTVRVDELLVERLPCNAPSLYVMAFRNNRPIQRNVCYLTIRDESTGETLHDSKCAPDTLPDGTGSLEFALGEWFITKQGKYLALAFVSTMTYDVTFTVKLVDGVDNDLK